MSLASVTRLRPADPDPGLVAAFTALGIEPRWALVVAAAYLMDVS